MSDNPFPKTARKIRIEDIDRGVKNVIILNGKVKHSIILELFTSEGFGTMIKG